MRYFAGAAIACALISLAPDASKAEGISQIESMDVLVDLVNEMSKDRNDSATLHGLRQTQSIDKFWPGDF